MKVVMMTGAIGSGKSTATKMFCDSAIARLGDDGVVHLDTDALVHQLLKRGSSAYSSVLAHFGDRILGAGGQIDRAALADIVFYSPDELRQLEEILHPEVAAECRERIAHARARAVELVVIEIPLFEKSGLSDVADVVVAISADEVLRRRRLISKGVSAEDALARIEAGADPESIVENADAIIENNSTCDQLKSRIVALVDHLL